MEWKNWDKINTYLKNKKRSKTLNEYYNFEIIAKQLISNLNKNDNVEYICYQMINNTLFNQKFKNYFINISLLET